MRGDLTGFFWPLAAYAKQSIYDYGQIPLWNRYMLGGTPLATDPQAPIFYLPNILHLIFPAGAAFLILYILHILIGAVGMYFLAKYLKLNKYAATLTAILYCLSPNLSRYVDAGHVGLVYTWGYLPFVYLATLKLADTQKNKHAIYLAISLSGLFYTHTVTFAISAISTLPLYLIKLAQNRSKLFALRQYVLSAMLTFGLIAPILVLQLRWQSQTNRGFLLANPETFPIWHGKLQFLAASINPLFHPDGITNIDTEKFIALGMGVLLLAFVGYIKLKSKLKIYFTVLFFVLALISLNNASPVYNLFLKIDYFVLFRVATRFWFLATIASVLLAAYGYQLLSKKHKYLANTLAMAAVLELGLISGVRIARPVAQEANVPESVYEYLATNTKGRVFCTTKCFSPIKVVEHKLETIEGYSTLIQKNYWRRAFVMMNTNWPDKYSLSIPPFFILSSEQLQPHALYLGEYAVDYVVSPHELTDPNLVLETQIDNYLIYKNILNKGYAYFENGDTPKSIWLSPNRLVYEFSGDQSGKLTLAEVYSPGWKAYLDGKQVVITETAEALRSVDISRGSKKLVLVYKLKYMLFHSETVFKQ